jgi:hypothetical protein
MIKRYKIVICLLFYTDNVISYTKLIYSLINHVVSSSDYLFILVYLTSLFSNEDFIASNERW